MLDFQALTNPFIIMTTFASKLYWSSNQDPALFRATSLPAMQGLRPWGERVSTGCWWVSPCLFQAPPRFLFRLPGPCIFKIEDWQTPLGWAMAACLWLMPIFLDNLSGSVPAFELPSSGWAGCERPWVAGAALLLRPCSSLTFLWRPWRRCLAWLLSRPGRDSPPPFPAQPPTSCFWVWEPCW